MSSSRAPEPAPRLSRLTYAPGGVPCEVVAGAGALRLVAAKLPGLAPGRWFVVSSRKVLGHTREALAELLSSAAVNPVPLLVADGEAGKSWESLGRLLDSLTRRGLRRDGGIVALGGGSVGDVAGLAASLALRGVPVVQVPTTLLAASDSSLGGKTAVNLPAGKNLAGTVHQPRLVVADTSLLASLPDRDFRSGLAEVVKSSFLDAAFGRRMDALEGPLARRDPAATAEAVFRSLRMKARKVEADPFETEGERFLLNLGHTVGHALESASGHRLAHGEAVAWGLLAILPLSVREAGLPRETATRLAARVTRLVRPPRLGRQVLSDWSGYLAADKKADRAGLRAVLLSAPGRARVARVDRDALASGLAAALDGYNRVA